jgi:arylsulfatase A-like enzyme
MFAVRQGRWKLIEGLGSGGFTSPARIEPGENDPAGQLYDLEADPGETTNVYLDHPEVVSDLSALLQRYRTEGRSAPRATP